MVRLEPRTGVFARPSRASRAASAPDRPGGTVTVVMVVIVSGDPEVGLNARLRFPVEGEVDLLGPHRDEAGDL